MFDGIVFGGGGAKGAYQIGAWWALKEHGLDKNIRFVSGSSVGALNGIMFAQRDFFKCFELWRKIEINDIMCMGVGEKIINIVKGRDGFFKRQCLQSIMEENIHGYFFDIKNCFIACTEKGAFPKVIYFDAAKTTAVKTIQILLASSAIPFVYDEVIIDGKHYCDGGITDNMPVKPIYNAGAKNIIAIGMEKDIFIDANDFENAKITLVKPKKDLGNLLTGTLNFSKYKIKELMLMGYKDCNELFYKPI